MFYARYLDNGSKMRNKSENLNTLLLGYAVFFRSYSRGFFLDDIALLGLYESFFYCLFSVLFS